MFFRSLLVLIAVVLAIRIIRGVIAALFPPVDPQEKTREGSPSKGQGKSKVEYRDIQDAKFKDL
jgi:hypothetical protein